MGYPKCVLSATGPHPSHFSQPKLGECSNRKPHHRFEYGDDSKCAFVELSPGNMISAEEFKRLLEAVPGVSEVEWHTAKGAEQKNVGNHYCERNLLVKSAHARHPIEFELTRHNHYVGLDKSKHTVTAMFKTPKVGNLAEAWRILYSATVGMHFSRSCQGVPQKAHSQVGCGRRY